MSSGDELETDHDNVDTFGQARRPCMSKAADTHTFRRLKTPSRCRECDSYVYFHGFECFECGLASHKKCLESLAIQCGRKRLPRKMTTFGVDLTSHAQESGEEIPYIVNKCIAEVEDKGYCLKGIYRVSGVKSKVEKLCQSFENGAELVDLDGVHPNVISNVLKLYLRQLPEPLLSYRLYPEFIKVAKDYPSQKTDESSTSSEGAVEELRKLVLRLPSIHLSTLKCLMHHLYRVSEYSNHNNMPPSNLGIVFGPTLLRTSEGSASLSSLVDTVHQTRVIELLITHAYEIFGPPLNQVISSQKDDVYSHKSKSKSVKYRGGKQALSRTVSGSSQTSDIEESQFLEVDHRRDGIPDLDDYPLPGYLPSDKSQELESCHQSSDVTHSSDDLLYSTLISDDDFPEILLSDDSVFKKSLPSPSDLLKPGQQPPSNKPDARTSLSSSPAVSEASHCSSLLRSTDDESASEWREGSLFPVPPPRKNAPPNLQLNQSFLHSSLDRKQVYSESSGISSAASTSPTHVTESSQSDPLYTSTASVTLGGQQKSPGSRASTSSMTAELRRQFFDLPPGTPPLTPKSPQDTSGRVESCSDDILLYSDLCVKGSVDGVCGNVECAKSPETCSLYQGASGRPRGYSLSHTSYAVEPFSSNAFFGKEEKMSTNSELTFSSKSDCHPDDLLLDSRDVLDGGSYLTSSHSERIERLDQEGRSKLYSLRHHVVQNAELPLQGEMDSVVSSRRYVESTVVSSNYGTESHHLERSTGDMKGVRGSDKLSPNRQPRFV